MAKLKMTATVVSQAQLAEGIYDLRLKAGEIASQAAAGQFVSVYSKDGSRLLPRPISLCGIDREAGELRLVYRIAGAGTEEFSTLKAGDTVDILGPLGNGFPLKEGKKAFLIGGGIGVPPMLELAKELKRLNGAELVQSVMGYRNSQTFLMDEFKDCLKAYAREKGIQCWISLEEKMACGVGACLACVCQSREKDEHSQVHNKRICKDGPVFLADEIEL